jgi:hypothetical protein
MATRRAVTDDRETLIDRAARGDATAREQLVTQAARDHAEQRVATDIRQRKAEHDAQAEGERVAAETLRKKSRADGLLDSIRAVADKVERRWQTERMGDGAGVEQIQGFYSDLYAVTHDPKYARDRVAERIRTWWTLRGEDVLGRQIPRAVAIPHRVQRLTLAEMLGVAPLPLTTPKEA